MKEKGRSRSRPPSRSLTRSTRGKRGDATHAHTRETTKAERFRPKTAAARRGCARPLSFLIKRSHERSAAKSGIVSGLASDFEKPKIGVERSERIMNFTDGRRRGRTRTSEEGDALVQRDRLLTRGHLSVCGGKESSSSGREETFTVGQMNQIRSQETKK